MAGIDHAARMKLTRLLILPAAMLISSCVTQESLQKKSYQARAMGVGSKVALYNGKDLGNWTPDVPKADNNPGLEPSFIVRDGNLVSLGRPLGHLTTNSTHSNYRLVVEYRFPGKPGNCGVLVHSSTPRVLYDMFPASIEVQMQHKHAGDFWVIGEDIKVPNMKERRKRNEGQKYGGFRGDARHILNLTDGSEKPLGDWNRMEIICKGREIIVWVNGDLVNYGYGASVQSGKISLQAEGSEVEFRKVNLYPLAAE